MGEIRYLSAGDAALVMEFGNSIAADINAKVKKVYDVLKDSPFPGVVEAVPTFRSLLIYYQPDVITREALIKKLKTLEASDSGSAAAKKKVFYIPVLYGGAFGEDLPDVAAHTGLSEKEVIERHSGRDYLIYMLGFLPGFAYLGGMDEKLVTPRLKNPRTKIAEGSVGIGGEQTGIYPLASPGGWRLIGRTPVKPYDPKRAEPFLYKAGDYIRFYPVDEAEYGRIEKAVADNAYICRTEEK